MKSEQDFYNELADYTLTKGDREFVHQYVVDAFAVQTANNDTKPIKVFFGLVGLYLHLKKGFSGREVQLAHMRMAKSRKVWPKIELPKIRGEMMAEDVLKSEPGNERDELIDKWCASIWEGCKQTHKQIEEYVNDKLLK